MSLDLLPPDAATTMPAGSITDALPDRILWIMAAACGVAAANIYYNQPLLNDFANYFHATATQAGLVATAAQVGYGVGIFFFVPLGDRLERRLIVLSLSYSCVVTLLAVSLAPSLRILILCQLLVGITAMSAQLLIPLAVDLTREDRRGHTVGTLMAGLLVGILLARTLGGFIGDHFGWRFMFGLAAGIMLIMTWILQATLPHRPPSTKLSYPALMHSLLHLLRTQPQLWIASIVSALSFGSFTAFWTVLSFLMKQHFNRGATDAGLFGIVGVFGAMAAPLAGKLSDRRGPAFTVTIALVSTIAAFVLMWNWVTIPGLIVGVLLMDMGVQSVQVAAQSQVMALVPDARSRVNTLYMVARFIGGAGGSAIAAIAWSHDGWPGACAAALGMLGVGIAVHVIGTHGRRVLGDRQSM